MSFSPQLFLSNIKAKDGLAKNNRFEVILPIPSYINSFIESSLIEKILNAPNSFFTDISSSIGKLFGSTGNAAQDEQSKTTNASLTRYLALQCESAELPGKTLQTADVKIYGPTFKVPYQTQYAETTLNFLCTNEFYERKLFERWMEAIMPTDTNNLRFPRGQGTRYLTNIKIIQYDEFIKQIYAVELIDAFPVGIAAQPLSWSEEGFHRLSIQFSYQRYRVIYAGRYDLAAAAAALFGTAGSRLFDSAIGGATNSVLGAIF